jgi:hypothetical protein
MRAVCLTAFMSLPGLIGCLGTGINEAWNIPVSARDNGQLPGNLPNAPPQMKAPAATSGEAVRVAKIGHEILTKNAGLGIHPIFQTTGETKLVLSHKAAKVVVISEALSSQCTDGELAALLSDELGRMVVEQESLATRVKPGGSLQPALGGGIDRDGGAFGPADGTMLAEAAMNSRRNQGVVAAPDLSYGLKSGDSVRMGEEILRRSGFQADDPAKVRDLRRQSAKGAA